MNYVPTSLLWLALLIPAAQAQETSVATLLAAPAKGQAATLDGRFVGKKDASTWRFQDATGEIRVDVDEADERDITRDMKKGAPIRLHGQLFRPFGSSAWELRFASAKRIHTRLPPPLSRPAPAPGGADTTPRKPYTMPRPTADTIAGVLRSPVTTPVDLSGTVMEVVSPRKILLWDGTAVIAVRLDHLSPIPELTRAQGLRVRGTLMREGAAFVELQARRIDPSSP